MLRQKYGILVKSRHCETALSQSGIQIVLSHRIRYNFNKEFQQERLVGAVSAGILNRVTLQNKIEIIACLYSSLELGERIYNWSCGNRMDSDMNASINIRREGLRMIGIDLDILGTGIHLFDMLEKEIKLKLIQTKCYNGIMDLVYERS